MKTYLMRVQALDSDKVHVVKATGKISTIVYALGRIGMYAINYIEAGGNEETILLIPIKK